MNITTKELFELAKIQSDAYDKHFADDDDFAPWDALSPIEQAATAESIRAVLTEWENRREQTTVNPFTGIPYAVWDVPEDDPLDASAWSIPAPDTETEPKPRVWDSLRDVPVSVRVRDKDGDAYRYFSDDSIWKWTHNGEDWFDTFDGWDDGFRSTAPYMEVLEKPEQFADWELELLGKWDRWEDVPEGVVVEARDGWYYRKIADQIRLDSGNISCWNGDSEFNDAKAPFTRVAD